MPEADPAYAGGSYERKRHPDYRPGCDFYTSGTKIISDLRPCQSRCQIADSSGRFLINMSYRFAHVPRVAGADIRVCFLSPWPRRRLLRAESTDSPAEQGAKAIKDNIEPFRQPGFGGLELGYRRVSERSHFVMVAPTKATQGRSSDHSSASVAVADVPLRPDRSHSAASLSDLSSPIVTSSRQNTGLRMRKEKLRTRISGHCRTK